MALLLIFCCCFSRLPSVKYRSSDLYSCRPAVPPALFCRSQSGQGGCYQKAWMKQLPSTLRSSTPVLPRLWKRCAFPVVSDTVPANGSWLWSSLIPHSEPGFFLHQGPLLQTLRFTWITLADSPPAVFGGHLHTKPLWEGKAHVPQLTCLFSMTAGHCRALWVGYTTVFPAWSQCHDSPLFSLCPRCVLGSRETAIETYTRSDMSAPNSR